MAEEIEKKINRTIKLPCPADLTFISFCEAIMIIEKHSVDAYGVGLKKLYEFLNVNIHNYHQAFKLSVSSGVNVEIKEDFERDEWSLTQTWIKDEKLYTLTVASEGA